MPRIFSIEKNEIVDMGKKGFIEKEYPQVVIIGGGFGGLSAAKALKKAPVKIVLVDRNNYHLFQPLLYQVATAGLSPAEIAQPVRTILRRQKNFRFRLAEVQGVDLKRHQLETSSGIIGYDYLILSVGSESSFFGQKSLERHSLDLKGLDDAVIMRNHILSQFELADQETDPETRRALLTFIVVGGGPTGVESAGAISELVRLVLIKDYPKLDFTEVQIVLVEMQSHLLDGFPEGLQENARRELERKHVEVLIGRRVKDYDGEKVLLDSGEEFLSRTLIWAAGVKANDLVQRLGIPPEKQQRVPVEPTLQLPGHPEVFVIGDAAFLEEDGKPLPLMAPVAVQQGRLAAENIQHLLMGEEPEHFIYKDPGSLATIGRNRAVARIGRLHFSGLIAWIVWLVVHLYGLIGFRNRILVLVNWVWDYFFFERAVRLITQYRKIDQKG